MVPVTEATGIALEIRALLDAHMPSPVRLAVATEIDDELAFPEERALTAPMVPRRAREFLTGRTLARRALRELGRPDAPLPIGPRRAPVWPVATVGSISHTEGFCVAIVASRTAYAGLGIDVERRGEVTPKLVPRIARSGEARTLARAGSGHTALFSAKEAVYKCVQPALGLEPTFKEVQVGDPIPGPFTARVTTGDVAGLDVAGLILRQRETVLSVAWLPAEG
jgi:4'-phosphopantetheinyl transferase EntD